MQILAFDFGVKSIGVAQVHREAAKLGAACSELPPLRARDGIPDPRQLETLFSEWAPATVLVGLPLDSAGEDMDITRRARKFGHRLQANFRVPVIFVDETLSTKAAKAEAHERGHRGNYARQPVDSIAARLILESWLNDQR